MDGPKVKGFISLGSIKRSLTKHTGVIGKCEHRDWLGKVKSGLLMMNWEGVFVVRKKYGDTIWSKCE